MAARNKIKSSIPRFFFKYFSPDPAKRRTLSDLSCMAAFGIFIKNKRVIKAVAKVARSKAITVSMLVRLKSAVAATGVNTVVSEFENVLSPLIF